MSAPPANPSPSAILDKARLLGSILRRAAHEDRPQCRPDDLVQAADLLLELAAVVVVTDDMATLMEDLLRQRDALRSLVERAKEAGIDEDWRKEARVVLRATGPAGQGPGVVDG